MPKTYIAIYEQDAVDDGWTAHIDAVPGCNVQARSLSSARARLREALAWRVGEDPGSVMIEDRMPPAIAAVTKRANRARREADRAVARAQQEVSKAALELAALGVVTNVASSWWVGPVVLPTVPTRGVGRIGT